MYDFTVLILEGSYASSVAVTLDLLAAAARLAPLVRAARPTWRVCSVEGGKLPLQGGLSVATTRLPARRGNDRSTWIIPGLGVERAAEIAPRVARDDAIQAAAAVTQHVRAGGQVAASCSAVFLLQAASVLDGRHVTTTWWLAPLLQRMNPGIAVNAERMVCADGAIVTAGAAFAQTDLMLHLLREHSGTALVDAVTRRLLIDGKQSQAAYIVPEAFANGDDLIARLAARIENALPKAPSVSQLAQEFCMSERTLSRHIHRATGRSTMALLQSVKLRRARALLESSRMTVEQVAEAVGYQDSTALRRMMKRIAGANPSRYRSKPGSVPAIVHAKPGSVPAIVHGLNRRAC